jgi:MSHA biogenesis protein MshP
LQVNKSAIRIQQSASRGVSIIAAIFIIVILAFMGVMLVSVRGTSTSSAVNELQSVRALSIAEGGLEFALRTGAFCAYNTAATTLGTGTFTVVSQYIGPGGTAPATLSGGNLPAGATAINVSSTANYRIPGTITIESEYIFCTGTAGTTSRLYAGWQARRMPSTTIWPR